MRFIQLRSAPAQNAGPFPASTMMRTYASRCSSVKAFFRSAMTASSNAFRTSGRFSVTRATPSFFSTRRWLMSHPEYAELRFLDRRVERSGNRETQQPPRVGGIDDAVVPEPRARIIGMPLALVLLADRRFEGLFSLSGRKIPFDRREDTRRLLAAHDRYARVRPHPQEAGAVGAAAHAVVAGAERAADDQRELGHLGGGDCGHHLRAVLGDTARLVLLADHVAGDVLQEEKRYAALAGELDEMRGLE